MRATILDIKVSNRERIDFLRPTGSKPVVDENAEQPRLAHYLVHFYNGLHYNHCNYCRNKLSTWHQDKNVSTRIWQDKRTGQFYLNQVPLPHFRPLEESILAHLLDHANQRQTFSQIIAAGWPGEVRDGISNDCVYRAISDIRKKIEINPSQPRYLLNWRGRPEGGYVLYPDGRVSSGQQRQIIR